ncbi:Co-chaperone Hsc20 [Xylariaceae sp. FL1651]|nr:Co-chaperone Hsc20 [Xylariaceae sp. FL1651]
MRTLAFPARQASRVCALCREQRVSTTRNFHSSSAQTKASSTRIALRVQRQIPCRPTESTKRTFVSSSTARSSQSEPAVASTGEPEPKPKVPQTHYEFFPKTLPSGPPPKGRFGIDVRALRREFLALQAGAHPDLHPAHMKARAEATSARINEAFKTLESPLLRAQHILAARGLDVANDETAKVEDPELLMLVLETRETIEEAEDEADLEGLRAENEARIRDCEARLEELFARDDLEAAKAEAVRLRYWINIRESIHNWEKGKPVVLQH